MKLLESSKSKINKNKDGDNVPCLEINKAVLFQCNIVNSNYQCDSILYFKKFLNRSFFILKYNLLIKILNP